MDGDTDSNVRSGKKILKNLVGVLLVMFVWSLFFGIVSSDDGTAASTSWWNLKHVVAVKMSRTYLPVNPDPVYTSKRRVPSGPDPFHNRHVGETRGPPDRV